MQSVLSSCLLCPWAAFRPARRHPGQRASPPRTRIAMNMKATRTATPIIRSADSTIRSIAGGEYRYTVRDGMSMSGFWLRSLTSVAIVQIPTEAEPAGGLTFFLSAAFGPGREPYGDAGTAANQGKAEHAGLSSRCSA